MTRAPVNKGKAPKVGHVGKLRKLVYQPGDTFVVMFPQTLNRDQCELVTAHVGRMLPGSKVMVLAGGAKIGLLAPGAVSEGASGTH